jgi:hypothetical protein
LRWVETQLLARLAGQEIPGALNILGRKRPAVVPLDALPQREGELGSVLAPRPAGGQIGQDRLHAVLFDVLVEHDEVVEHAHHCPRRDGIHLLVHRQARRGVKSVHVQNTARLLRK